MARFPRTEASIAQLARHIVNGLEELAEDFPAPPVPPDPLRARLEAYQQTVHLTTRLEGELTQAHVRKDQALEDLAEAAKVDLRYAELMTRDNPEKLLALGWGRRRDRSPLQKPGDVLNIAIVKEGDTWITLRWDAPVSGGKVAAYVIKRRRAGGSRWIPVDTAIETEHMLTDQPRGEELEFIVIGTNKAGDGRPSGTVTAVL